MTKRIFELHLGLDQNEVTGDLDYTISGKVAKQAQNTLLGGTILGVLGVLDKQSKQKTLNAVNVVDTIMIPDNTNGNNVNINEAKAQELADKWKKK